MPTGNRRRFIPRSIDCFLSQTYPNLQIVILDDGDESIADLLPNDVRIKYAYQHERLCLGAKRNIVNAMADGEFTIHWDDDDFYSPARVARQIAPFLDDPMVRVTGTSVLYYYRENTSEAWKYEGEGNWMAGIAYRKDVGILFDEEGYGSDLRFQQKLSNWYDLKDPSLIVAAIHDTNTAPKEITSLWTPEPWANLPSRYRPSEPRP